MSDTWLYLHDGTYYLYFLAGTANSASNNVSMAVSSDGVPENERLEQPVADRVVFPAGRWAGGGGAIESLGRSTAPHRARVVRPERILQRADHHDLDRIGAGPDPLGYVRLPRLC